MSGLYIKKLILYMYEKGAEKVQWCCKWFESYRFGWILAINDAKNLSEMLIFQLLGGYEMKQQITFRQYRAMDLFLFTVLGCLCEALIALGATRWFPGEPYTLSVIPAVTAVVMVRWGGFAALPAVLGAFVFCLVSGATLPQYIIYCVGNLASLVLTQVLCRDGWKRLHENVLFALLYGILTAVVMQAGRFLIALVMGNSLQLCVGFITTDTLSILFAALIVWITRRLDGVLEEQKHYLKRVAEEMEKEREAQAGGYEL